NLKGGVDWGLQCTPNVTSVLRNACGMHFKRSAMHSRVSDERRGARRAPGRAGIFTPVTLLARTKGWLVTARAPRKPKAASRTWASPNQPSHRFLARAAWE